MNYNVIGNVNGDDNIGNDGAANSNDVLNANANGNSGERNNDGYQKDKDISCIISNNNTIITGNGIATDGNENITDTCEECFLNNLNGTQLGIVLQLLPNNDLRQFCEFLSDPT